MAKPFAALTVLTAVADGALGLDQPVAEVWPAYGAHGKDAHDRAARAVPTRPACRSRDATCRSTTSPASRTCSRLAEPVHEPGTAVAEHALTYGHLCDALVRHATGADLADRFAALAAAHGWDLHLRVPAADLDRVADVVPSTTAWRGLTPTTRAGDRPWRTRPGSSTPPCSTPSAGAPRRSRRSACTPRRAGWPRFYDDLLRPDGAVAGLLGPDLHRDYVGPQVTGHDLRARPRGHLDAAASRSTSEDLGMGGAGGCAAGSRSAAGDAAAYVTRGLGTHDRADDVWDALTSG